MPDDGAVACGPAHGGVHGPCGVPPHPTIAFKAVIAYHAVSVRSFHEKRRFVDLDLLRRICRLIPRLIEPSFWWRLLAELAIEFWGRRGRGEKKVRAQGFIFARCAAQNLAGSGQCIFCPTLCLIFPRALPRRDLNSSFESHNVFRNE